MCPRSFMCSEVEVGRKQYVTRAVTYVPGPSLLSLLLGFQGGEQILSAMPSHCAISLLEPANLDWPIENVT